MNASVPPQRRLDELATLLNATLVGDGAFMVAAVNHPLLLTRPDALALAMDKGSYAVADKGPAQAVIVEKGSAIDLDHFVGGLIVERGRYALARLLDLFEQPVHVAPGIHPTAFIDDTATLGDGVSVGPFVAIGPGAKIGDNVRLVGHVTIGAGAVLGDDVLLHAGVRIGDGCVLGRGVIIQHNTSIGADGFGYATPELGSVEAAKSTGTVSATNMEIARINSIGTVQLGDNVEIGANSCVDRGTLGATRIGTGTKIDNLVQIGHNVTIGENCLIAGQCGLAGSCKIGNRVVLAGNVGIADHRTIGDDVIILPKAGVGRDIPAGSIWGGMPAIPKDDMVKEMFALSRLPRLIRDVEQVKQQLKQGAGQAPAAGGGMGNSGERE